jgi:hypothetical protein
MDEDADVFRLFQGYLMENIGTAAGTVPIDSGSVATNTFVKLRNN